MSLTDNYISTTSNDYTFPLDHDVDRTPVRFKNRYGIEIAADLYVPKNATGKLRALAVSGPFGAVKEQSAGLYANEYASRGYVALAFDPSFTGESGGDIRDVGSPEIYTRTSAQPSTSSDCRTSSTASGSACRPSAV